MAPNWSPFTIRFAKAKFVGFAGLAEHEGEEAAMSGRRVSSIFNGRAGALRAKVTGMFALLVAGNVAAWIWALIMFRDSPILLGTAFLAYSFGVRHAFDADHIAAIDNVTRKLMQGGKRPVTVGFFFSLGHSTVVVALSVLIALTSTAVAERYFAFQDYGAGLGSRASA